MVTLILQLWIPALMIGFGYAALRIYREGHDFWNAHTAGWAVTAATFLLNGTNSLVHSSLAVWAFAAGPGTGMYSRFLEWSPVGNASRSTVVIAYGALLVLVLVLGGIPQRAALLLSILVPVLAMLAGGTVERVAGSLVAGQHFSTLATFSLVSLILLLSALLYALVRNAMDHLLWLAVSVYALREALDVIWFSALVWLGTPGAWAPSPMMTMVYTLLAQAMMLALAFRRLVLARRREPVPGLLELFDEKRPSLLG